MTGYNQIYTRLGWLDRNSLDEHGFLDICIGTSDDLMGSDWRILTAIPEYIWANKTGPDYC